MMVIDKGWYKKENTYFLVTILLQVPIFFKYLSWKQKQQ